jgi:hypothetical protein
MASEHMFGVGPGHLDDKANQIAMCYGAWLVNFTDAACNCGYRCAPHTCVESQRHWFSCLNTGNGDATASRVMSALAKAAHVGASPHCHVPNHRCPNGACDWGDGSPP